MHGNKQAHYLMMEREVLTNFAHGFIWNQNANSKSHEDSNL